MILDAPIISKTGRVVLSAQTEADDEAVAALYNDPGARRFLRFLPSRVSVADIRARRLADAVDPTFMALNIHMRNGVGQLQFVGIFRFYRIERVFGNSFELGIIMRPAHFGGGMAREAFHAALRYAFEEQKFHRVVFHTAADNAIIREWITRAGGKLDGIERDYWSNGKGGYTDVCLYSGLSSEWFGGAKVGMERAIANAGMERARL